MALTLTYAELAERLGRSEPAAKSLAKRKRWRRSVGNDGLARVIIDDDELTTMADPDRHTVGRPPANSTRAQAPSDPGPDPVQTRIAELEARLVEMRAEVDLARSDRDQARADRDQERQERHAERDRADQAHTRADRIAAELRDLAERFASSIEDARSRESTLAEKLDAVRSEMAALRSRPWWKRLVG